MLKRLLTYCLLLLPVCTVMADGVDHLGSIREVMKAEGDLGQIQTMVTDSLTKVKLNIYGWIF